MTIRTRFAPSPTGYLHIGGARTALFSWLFAKKQGGEFVLRIEDTDRERSTQASVDAILEGMSWLGLKEDLGPYYQTKRFDRYEEIIQQLMAQGDAYYCYCTKEELDALREQQMANKEKPRYDGRWRDKEGPREGVDPVIRFRNPLDGDVVVKDAVRGEVIISNQELDDLIIARSDGTPTYNLTVVVDDMDMGVTHVIRGDDHLNNTPRQINILKALGAEPPVYAHVPMILGSDGKRLSKRHGAVSVMQYRDEGYMPEALLNYLVRLGWSQGDQEIFSLDEMQELFSLEGVNKAASTFNPEKLLWLNQHYLKTLPAERIAEEFRFHLDKAGVATEQGPALENVIEGFRERAKTLVEMVESSRFAFEDFESYDEKAAKKNFKGDAAAVLQRLYDAFAAMQEWDGHKLHETVLATAEAMELKLGKVAQPLRVAVCGTSVSPGMDVTLELIGRERTLARIQKAIQFMENAA